MRRQGKLSIALLCLCLAVFAAGSSAQSPSKAAQKTEVAKKADVAKAERGAEVARTNAEFDSRVNAYVLQRRNLESSLPRLGTKETPEKITAHQKALAQKIRDARANAKPGDIFTPEVSAQIRSFFKGEMKGPKARAVKNTIRGGDPLPDMRLKVGMEYPEKLPYTTVPPDILKKLPQLPKEVTYRIVGHDLLLLDQVANIVVDFVPEALP